MKKKIIFKGVATAIITPFLGGEIDYGALGKIIERQIEAGINALVVGGTTGECATLSLYEKHKLYAFAKEKTEGRVPLILGASSNDTKSAAELARYASKLGADAILSVTPYYNKGTDEGLYTHFATISESSSVPVILYNVPSRTCVNLPIRTVKRLAELENIAAIKEADSSAERLMELSELGEGLALYSGNDSLTYTTLSIGGLGVISVLSNALPEEMLKITDSYFSGDMDSALREQKRLLPIIRAMFSETNPSPIKYAMEYLNLASGALRLPLTEPKESTRELIKLELSRLKIR